MFSFSYSSTKGNALIEFLVVAIVLIFLGLLAIEGSRWYITRQALHYALFQAARTGAVQHAQLIPIQERFQQSLKGLIPHYFLTHNWSIHIQSPNQEDFKRFSQPLPNVAHQHSIRNDYQIAQDQIFSSSTSNLSHLNNDPSSNTKARSRRIFDANTLSLKLVYPYQPLLPQLWQRLLNTLALKKTEYGDLLKEGLLPIVLYTSIAMQSDPWQNFNPQTTFSPKTQPSDTIHSPEASVPLPESSKSLTTPILTKSSPLEAIDSKTPIGIHSEPMGAWPQFNEPSLCGVSLCC